MRLASREIAVWLRDRRIAGLRESDTRYGQWVFFPCVGRSVQHATAHDPTPRHGRGQVHIGRSVGRAQKVPIFHMFPLGDSTDERGNPVAIVAGAIRNESRCIDLGFFTFIPTAPAGDRGSPRGGDLVIPPGRYERVTVAAALRGESAEEMDWPPVSQGQIEMCVSETSEWPHLLLSVVLTPSPPTPPTASLRT